MSRHARAGRRGWFTPGRVSFGVSQAAATVISAVAAALLGVLWHAVLAAGHQVERLTDEIRARPTAASPAQIADLTRKVEAIPTTQATSAPTRVVVSPAGPGSVAVTVLPAPQVAPQAITPRQPSPGPITPATPSKAPTSPLCAAVSILCAQQPHFSPQRPQ